MKPRRVNIRLFWFTQKKKGIKKRLFEPQRSAGEHRSPHEFEQKETKILDLHSSDDTNLFAKKFIST